MPDPGFAVDDMGQLVEAAATVAGQTDLEHVLLATVEAAVPMTGAAYGALGVLDGSGGLEEFIHVGIDPETAALIGHLPEGRGVLGTITRQAAPIRLDRISDHPDSVGFPAHHPPMETFLGVPIRLGLEIFGNLYLTEKPHGFTARDEARIQALATVAGSAIRNARLQTQLRRFAVVEDRERIARELHDAIIQDLFAVGLSLQGHASRLPEAEARHILEDAVGRLDEVISRLRRSIFDLQPPASAAVDIRAMVSDTVDRIAEPHPATVEVTFAGPLDELPHGVARAMVQLVGEAVSNALRHSGSVVVHVEVRRRGDELIGAVVDEGTGFDPTVAGPGRGLSNLKERALAAGGETTVTSRPGRGTSVTIRLPLR